MIVYHGSTEIVKLPKIIKTDKGRDFGAGFYTTDIKEQAERWARRKALSERRFSMDSKAVLNIYEFDDDAYKTLKTFHFPDSSLDWLDMIVKCRKNANYTHGYDIVSGKIANDNVGETVMYVLKDVMRPEDAIEKLKFEKINNQICFCTEKSLKYINFKEAREV